MKTADFTMFFVEKAVKQETFTIVSSADGKSAFFQDVAKEVTVDPSKVITSDDLKPVLEGNFVTLPFVPLFSRNLTRISLLV